MASYDIIGNIAIIKPDNKTKKEKLQEAKKLLSQPSIKTVLEKATDVKGRLRIFKTKFIAGKKNLIAIYHENKCIFKFNVEKCYFSSRLGNDRKEIAKKIKKSDSVLVMFAGVGPYPIVFYKIAKPKHITTIEFGKECNKFLKENIKLNKIPELAITQIQGDVKTKIPKEKFDVIMMARPNLKESFLSYALKVSKKGTRIFYHAFCRDNDLPLIKEKLINEAKIMKKSLKFNKIVKAGEIAPYKFRYRLEMKVTK